MPFTPFNFANLGTLNLAASSGSAAVLDIYLDEISQSLSLLFNVVATGTLGVRVDLYSGYGGPDLNNQAVEGLKVVYGGSSVPMYGSQSVAFSHALTSTVVPAPSNGQEFSLDILDTLNAANGIGQGNWVRVKVSALDLETGSVQILAAYR